MASGCESGANEFFNTPLDENGRLPDIKYADEGHRIVDTNRTDPVELSKLNGQYWDQNGAYHPPNTEGYPGKTSGGLDEAVVNQIPNTPDNVSYTKIDGFRRGEDGVLNYSKITDGYSTNASASNTANENIASTNGPDPRDAPLPKFNPEAPASTIPVEPISGSMNNGVSF